MFLLQRLQSSAAVRAPAPTNKLSAAMLLLPTAVPPTASASTRAAAAAAISGCGACSAAAAEAPPTAVSTVSAAPVAHARSACALAPVDLEPAADVFRAGIAVAIKLNWKQRDFKRIKFWKDCMNRCSPTKSASPYALAAPTGIPSPQYLARAAAINAARAAQEPEPERSPSDNDARASATTTTTSATTTTTSATATATATATTTATTTVTAPSARDAARTLINAFEALASRPVMATATASAAGAAACCVLVWSSLTTDPVVRSDTNRARRALDDLRVVYREVDAATCKDHQLRAMASIGGTRGVYPQLFLASPSTDEVRFISLGQLEQAEHFLGVPRDELARLKMEHATARVLFPGVATVTPTFDALPALQRALA